MDSELIRKARQGLEHCYDPALSCETCPYQRAYGCYDTELNADIAALSREAADDTTLQPELRDLAGKLCTAFEIHRDVETGCEQCPYAEEGDNCPACRELEALRLLRLLDEKEK